MATPTRKRDKKLVNSRKDKKIKEIKNIAIKFRNAILSIEKDNRPICLRDFPLGSCGDASSLLGKYLEQKGFGKFTYVSSQRISKPEESHAWIKGDNLIIDITADQFDEINFEVIVAEKSAFHETFEIIKTDDVNFLSATVQLAKFYEVLKDLME